MLERLDALLTRVRHRLPQVGPQPRPGRRRPRPAAAAGVHAQTLAVYRLLDELRAAPPRRRDRVAARPAAPGSTSASWTAPTGSGPATATTRWSARRSSAGPSCCCRRSWSAATSARRASHTTGRTHDLSFRGATALFGHFGIEWDVGGLPAEDLASLAALVATYRKHRSLLHSGDVVHADHPDPAATVHGVVAADRSEALMAYVSLTSRAAEAPGPARLPGLDPAADYRVDLVDTGGEPWTKQHAGSRLVAGAGRCWPGAAGRLPGAGRPADAGARPRAGSGPAPHPRLTAARAGPGPCPVRLRCADGRLLQTGVPTRPPWDVWHAVNGTLANALLVGFFLVLGGFFSGSEIALVSLREGQVKALAQRGRRGEKVAALHADPNRFLAAAQVGVTLAGFLSAAFGASAFADDLAPVLRGWGLSDGPGDQTGDKDAAYWLAFIIVTLVITYLALVIGELAPKRLALQRAEGIALAAAPTLDRLARVSRPVIWLLSRSTDLVVRLLGGDPRAGRETISEEELRGIVAGHETPRPRGAPAHRGRLRGRRPPAARGDGAAHRGRLPRRHDSGLQGGQAVVEQPAQPLPGRARLARRGRRLRARPRPVRPRGQPAPPSGSARSPAR